MLMLLIRLRAILILSTFEQIVLLKPRVYTPTLKNIRWYAISKSLRTTGLEHNNNILDHKRNENTLCWKDEFCSEKWLINLSLYYLTAKLRK